MQLSSFQRRHIGINEAESLEMLSRIRVENIDQLIDETIPDDIRLTGEFDMPPALTEHDFLLHLENIANKNIIGSNFIGQGYYGTFTPSVILRNVFQNPGWYTQYTPYQAEIAQGRLEALLNFQTMVSDLTGLPIANASLLDEATAAAEAMAMFEGIWSKKKKGQKAAKFFVDKEVYIQTLDVVITRAIPLNIEVVVGDYKDFSPGDDYFGALVQYPNAKGALKDYRDFVVKCNELDILVCVASDLMALSLITPPGEWGADAVVGNSQRFGVPMGYGGPHAAFFATKEDYKRLIPGRIIGVSIDRQGNNALRMALQTREQHIKREKATSNICTAQALLAVMAGFYAVYHGPEGIKDIASTIHKKTCSLVNWFVDNGFKLHTEHLFDTIFLHVDISFCDKVKRIAAAKNYNFFYTKEGISISVDETTSQENLRGIIDIFTQASSDNNGNKYVESEPNPKHESRIPKDLERQTPFMTHPVFNDFHTETKMMRYVKSLENKDLSLVHSMISLGSCTMKLNAATELIPVSWAEFANLHPFAPLDQTKGYQQIFTELEKYLCEITGFTACSLQPNSGAQGEYAGLMAIASYHHSRNEQHRKVALIPSSAHGTNPASAVMAGMTVVVVRCDENGNIDVDDLREKAKQHKDQLAALMITYPSTHGVFEKRIIEICKIIHENGGLVYMDGANMNAQVGFTNPGIIGADVCHLNLHKTFAIPHGGGGPGMGPICVNDKLAPFLPGHKLVDNGLPDENTAISAAPWGSSSILLISYAYIRMLGKKGLTNATRYAILNANYMKAILEEHYPVLYTGNKGRVAHEMIIDLRQFKAINISAEDVAKRLIDYGFHAPTVSFPVAGTIMIEPTESESKDELDRFCEAMISIKQEIDNVASGTFDKEDNVLHNAPHTLSVITSDVWEHPYSRKQAAYPLAYLTPFKFWSSVSRVDNAFGDRNLVCTCPPIESYENSDV